MRTIKASEIGVFLYCQRAWYYQKKGVASENIKELALGRQMHTEHGKAAMAVGFYRLVGYVLLMAAVLMAVVHFTSRLF
ncbi:MAG: hypothetical protein OEZ02_00160 [Anaerolineae bacterium]|nr:hypothetical protein [Anaerolineae bacterium]